MYTKKQKFVATIGKSVKNGTVCNICTLKRLKIVNFKNFGAFEAEIFTEDKLPDRAQRHRQDKHTGRRLRPVASPESHFASTDVQNIRHGENFMMLEGVFSDESGDRQVLMSLQRGAKKTVKRDGKQVERMGEYIGAYPLVIVSPADRDLIADGSSLRRKFIDGVVFQTSSQHLDAVVSHARIIELRNALLKTPSATSLQIDVYDKAMIELGRKIYEGRQSFPSGSSRIQKDILGYIRRRGTSGHNIYEHLRKPGCRGNTARRQGSGPYGRFFHHRSAQGRP